MKEYYYHFVGLIGIYVPWAFPLLVVSKEEDYSDWVIAVIFICHLLQVSVSMGAGNIDKDSSLRVPIVIATTAAILVTSIFAGLFPLCLLWVVPVIWYNVTAMQIKRDKKV